MSEQVIILSSSSPSINGEFLNFEDGMYLGGQIRMEAAVELARTQGDINFIVVGGYNKEDDLQNSDRVMGMEQFIRERIINARVKSIKSLPCTHHNLVAIFNTVSDEIDNNVGVLTNSYHLPRALEFARRAQHEVGLTRRIGLIGISAEDVLNRPIEDIILGHENEYQSRLDAEERGLMALREGTYRDSCLSTYREILSGVIRKFPDILLTIDEQREFSTAF